MRNKHWVAIADALRSTRPNTQAKTGGPNDWYINGRQAEWELIRDAIANALDGLNLTRPWFNRAEWIAYIMRE